MNFAFYKHRAKIFSLFIFLMIGTNVNAQVQHVNGMVISANERLSGAAIRNLSTQRQCISDSRGMFNIQVKQGDTLLTTKPFYKTDTLVYNLQDNLVIQLKQTVKVLKQVDIKDSVLTPLQVYDQNKKDYKDIYWKGDKSHMFSVVLATSPGVNVNIDKLYSALSKQGHDARRLQRTLTRDYKNSVIDAHFSKSLVGRITGYKGDRLDDFISKYRPSYEFVTKATDYDVIQYIRKKLKET